jgi:hypothetical protein
MIAAIVYFLCGSLSTLCSLILFIQFRRTGTRLLLWSCICFFGLALNNVLLFIDMMLVPNLDLSTVRMIPALIGVAVLIYGFVWDTA